MAVVLNRTLRLVWSAMLVVGLSGVASARADAATTPAVSVSPGEVDVGGTVHVTGSGFAPRSVITAQVCGRNAVDGSADCDLVDSQTVAGTMEGAFVADIPVAVPPVPCPCVVWVHAADGGQDAQHPIVVRGAPGPTAGPTAPVARPTGTIKIESVTIGSATWRSWIGLSDPRPLTVVVRNIGSAPYDQLRLVVTKGRGDDPHGFVPLPPLQRVGPGQTAKVTTSVDLGPAAVGDYTVRVRAGSGTDGATRRVHTSVWPWGWLLVALLLVQLVLLGFRNAARRRLARKEAEQAALGVSSVVPVALPEPAPSPAPSLASVAAVAAVAAAVDEIDWRNAMDEIDWRDAVDEIVLPPLRWSAPEIDEFELPPLAWSAAALEREHSAVG